MKEKWAQEETFFAYAHLAFLQCNTEDDEPDKFPIKTKKAEIIIWFKFL